MARARTRGRRGASNSRSDLREKVAELERDRALLNAIANNAPSLLCLIDPDGMVRPYATNRAFERVLGYRPDETGGVVFWEQYVPDGERAAARDTVHAAVRTQATVECEGRWLQRDGTPIDISWTCTPLPMIASGPVYLISGVDITDRKRHEQEVRDSRARIVAAADDARRRLERNLHDGAQQRLIRAPPPTARSAARERRPRRNPYAGTGLLGLGDRVMALDGEIFVDSPDGGGTRIRAELPLDWR